MSEQGANPSLVKSGTKINRLLRIYRLCCGGWEEFSISSGISFEFYVSPCSPIILVICTATIFSARVLRAVCVLSKHFGIVLGRSEERQSFQRLLFLLAF